ncbi:hypothetical protein HK405_006313, partial [Cladochytrium tenue]
QVIALHCLPPTYRNGAGGRVLQHGLLALTRGGALFLFGVPEEVPTRGSGGSGPELMEVFHTGAGATGMCISLVPPEIIGSSAAGTEGGVATAASGGWVRRRSTLVGGSGSGRMGSGAAAAGDKGSAMAAATTAAAAAATAAATELANPTAATASTGRPMDVASATVASPPPLASRSSPTQYQPPSPSPAPSPLANLRPLRNRLHNQPGRGGTDDAAPTASLSRLHLSAQSIATPFEPAAATAARSVAPPSGDWRATLASSLGHLTLNVAATVAPNKEKWATSLATVNDSPFVALGCASGSNNLFVYENVSDALRWHHDPSQAVVAGAHADFLKLRSAFTAPDPIHSLAVGGGLLATGGPSSSVQLFSIETAELGKKGKGLEHVGQCLVSDLTTANVKVAPPGTRSSSVRVQKLAFLPTADRSTRPASFVALQGRKVRLCDTQTMKVTASEMASFDQLTAVSWSPHGSSHPLIAVGGVDHHLSILDTRLMGQNTDKAVVWKAIKAHEGEHHPAISAVQFSPFVPYWLASAGEDSVVKVWDIRRLQFPVALIEGHYMGVQGMAWSACHAEMMATGSADGRFRVWCLEPNNLIPRHPSKSTYIGCPGTEWTGLDMSPPARATTPLCVSARLAGDLDELSDGPIIAIAASSSHLNTFYSLTSTGELSSFTIRREALEHLTPHRYGSSAAPTLAVGSPRTPPGAVAGAPSPKGSTAVADEGDESEERAVETFVHTRDLAAAFSAVTALSRRSLAETRGLARHERALIELCTARPPVDERRWRLPGLGGQPTPQASSTTVTAAEEAEAALEKFRSELITFSYYLPPRFGQLKRFYDLIPAKTRLEFEMVVLRYNILVDVTKKNWDNIVKAEKMILKGMEVDPTFMEPETLQLLVEAVVPNDFPQALSMGIKFSEMIHDTSTGGAASSPAARFPRLRGLVTMSLFPTTYDGADWLVEPSNFEASWAEGRGPSIRQAWLRQFLDEQRAFAAEKEAAGKGGLVAAAGEPGAGVGDREARKAAALEALMASPKDVLRMLRTERLVVVPSFSDRVLDHWNDLTSLFPSTVSRLAKLLARSESLANEEIAETIIRIVTTDEDPEEVTARDGGGGGGAAQGQAYKATISATTNRLFLDCLIATRRFEEYFQTASDFVT